MISEIDFEIDEILNRSFSRNRLKGQFCYKNILLFDVPESDLLQHWEDTYKFILNAAKSNGKVLIHCKMGISRSASTVCAFLMKYKSWGLKHALRFVKGMTHFV